jgi:hypothetical protein
MPTKDEARTDSVAVANRATTQILGKVRNDRVGKTAPAGGPNPIAPQASPTNTAQAWLHGAAASAAEQQKPHGAQQRAVRSRG